MSEKETNIQYIPVQPIQPECHEDEIDLRDLVKTIINYKNFILFFTLTITIISLIYTYLKYKTPIYNGNVTIEIGKALTSEGKLIPIDNTHTLSNILPKLYNVSATIPKRTSNIIILQKKDVNKQKISKELNKAVKFILSRNQQLSSYFEKIIPTQQVGNIQISKQPTKKKLIIIVAFITGFILSIFLVFFIEFIKNFKNEEEQSKI